VEATEKLLSAELAASAGLRTESATLASELSNVKSELASTAQQLEAERAESKDIRAQLEAIKSEYITAGRFHLAWHLFQQTLQNPSSWPTKACTAAW